MKSVSQLLQVSAEQEGGAGPLLLPEIALASPGEGASFPTVRSGP